MPRRTSGDMRPARLHVETLAAGEVQLAGERAHYLTTVLRLRAGAAVTLFDGQGRRALAEVAAIEGRSVRLHVTAPEREPQPRCTLTVAVAPPRADRADWLVEKLTELGVAEIVWVSLARASTASRAGSERSERWQRVARAAAAQCGNCRVPAIVTLPLAELLARDVEARLLAQKGGVPILRAMTVLPHRAVLLVGAEGGLAPAELAEADRAGYTRVSFGRHTLRVETAAVVGAGLIMELAEGA